MSLMPFLRRREAAEPTAPLAPFLSGYSIEVMPRTAEKIEDFRAILPKGTRVYVAHIQGTAIEDMVATAARLTAEGFEAMPHIPARLLTSQAEFEDWLARYADVGVTSALVLGGGLSAPLGPYDSSMQLLESGAFDRAGFTRLHVAGHPEGNRDIDRDGGERVVMEALRWKQDFANRTDARMAIATQFCFEAAPVIDWVGRLAAAGIDIPVHIGIAGPAKLQTLIKFAMACGVGPSLRVLQKRAMDVTRLVMPYTPDEVLAGLAAHKAAHPAFGIAQVHLFPLGGIKAATDWAAERLSAGAAPLAAKG